MAWCLFLHLKQFNWFLHLPVLWSSLKQFLQRSRFFARSRRFCTDRALKILHNSQQCLGFTLVDSRASKYIIWDLMNLFSCSRIGGSFESAKNFRKSLKVFSSKRLVDRLINYIVFAYIICFLLNKNNIPFKYNCRYSFFKKKVYWKEKYAYSNFTYTTHTMNFPSNFINHSTTYTLTPSKVNNAKKKKRKSSSKDTKSKFAWLKVCSYYLPQRIAAITHNSNIWFKVLYLYVQCSARCTFAQWRTYREKHTKLSLSHSLASDRS